MDYLKNLNEARQRAWDEAKAVLDVAAAESREFNAEEQAKWDTINADIDAKDATIRDLKAIETREREAAEARQAWEGVTAPNGTAVSGAEAREMEEIEKFFRGQSSRALDLNFSQIAREKNLIRNGAAGRELRTILQEDVTALGGALLPTTFLRQLYDFMEWTSAVRQLNVTVLTTAGGEPLALPKVVSHGTASLKGEGTALAEVDPTFTTVTLNAWKYGSLSQVSSEMIADSGVDILSFVAEDAGRAIGRVTDVDYTTGSGSSKPTGVLKSLGTGATAQTVATGRPSYSNLIDLVYSINPLYRQRGAQWFMLDRTAAAIRKMTDSQNRPLWEPSLQVGEPDMLMGYPVVQGPNVPALGTAADTAIAFGWWGGHVIRDVGTLRFERSDDFAFSTDLVTFRAILRTDAKLRDLSGSAKIMITPTT